MATPSSFPEEEATLFLNHQLVGVDLTVLDLLSSAPNNEDHLRIHRYARSLRLDEESFERDVTEFERLGGKVSNRLRWPNLLSQRIPPPFGFKLSTPNQ